MRVLLACSAHIGHLNPMLVVARALVRLGHDVHFRSMEVVRAKVVGTGAIFHDAVGSQPEFYAGRNLSGPLGALEDVMLQHGLDPTSFLSHLQVYNLVLEQQLPGAVRLVRQLRPEVVIYDAITTCRDIMFAAKILQTPAIGIWSLAGPGAWATHAVTTMLPLTLDDADGLVAGFAPAAAAVARVKQVYGLELCLGLPQPAGKVDTFNADAVLITTSADLQDPMTEDLARAYENDGTNFVYVGPLLADSASIPDDDEIVLSVRSARAQGRAVILVSMGTLLVSDHKLNGWEGRSGGSSLTGCQLCHAAWGGAFDAFGSSSADEGALIIMSLGPQADPFGDLIVPPNAICATFVNQQRVLETGVDVFLTHGGQNSFTEAVTYCTPMVVCPGFGDQVVNSRKAVALGVGLKVDRPQGDSDSDGTVAVQYKEEVCRALRKVHTAPSYLDTARECSSRLRATGGVPAAVSLVLSTAAGGRHQPAGSPKNEAHSFTFPLAGAVAVGGA